MLHRILIASVTGLALVLPLSPATPMARAGLCHCHEYKVLYRPCGTCLPWKCYGAYHCKLRAKKVIRELRCQGFEACIG